VENNAGFFQNAIGEYSSTKAFNILYSLIVGFVWAYLSIRNGEMIDFKMSVLAPLGGGMVLNTVNKKIEANSNSDKVKFIKAIMAKVKKE
jgi:hypothetical protein